MSKLSRKNQTKVLKFAFLMLREDTMRTVKIILMSLIVSLLCGLLAPAWAKAQSVEALDARDQLLVLDEVNKYRHSRGLAPLKLNAYMSREAALHSRDMANKRMGFGHKDFDKRIKRIYAKVQFCRAGAENIAYFKISPREVVRKWLTSPGHRRNIEGHYNLTGIGLARDKKGWVYYTQIFLRTENPAYR